MTSLREGRGASASTLAPLLALLLLTSACASGPSDSVQELRACAPGELDGPLNLYNWADFIDPALLEEFSARTGVDVTQDYFASDDELLARLQTGVSAYDVVVPSDYMVTILASDGLLRPIDAAAVPNTVHLEERFTDPAYDPQMSHSRPYLYGFTGIGVDRSVVGDVEASWALLFDPETVAQHGGRISLLDDSREVLGAALMWLGYSLNTTDPNELAEAEAVVAQATSWVTTFDSSDPTGLLVDGEVAVAHIWNGLMATADAGGRYELLVPVEGAVQYVSAVAIPATAPHPCTAHTFIDFLLEPASGAALTNATGYPTPNGAALSLLDPEVLADERIFPPSEVADRLFELVDTGDFEPNYTEAFLRARG
jgi:spermidine/putrescine transport system substrate-binding protein